MAQPAVLESPDEKVSSGRGQTMADIYGATHVFFRSVQVFMLLTNSVIIVAAFCFWLVG
jgi:hypothetical protein